VCKILMLGFKTCGKQISVVWRSWVQALQSNSNCTYLEKK
jgi:hypothetical protein